MVQSVAVVVPADGGDLSGSLSVEIARTGQDLEACQRLRHQVFAGEMGAHLHSRRPGIDEDEFDAFCTHLMVRHSDSGQVVGTTRLLLDRDARRGHGFYSETEFNLDNIVTLPGTILEVGRTCIHADFRSRSALAILWSGLARMVDIHQVDYLIGCASIEMGNRGLAARALIERLAERYALADAQAVRPRLPLPPVEHGGPDEAVTVPPLLKGYLRLGARVSREACWDPDFDVADLFVVLDRDNLERRYARHFMGTS